MERVVEGLAQVLERVARAIVIVCVTGIVLAVLYGIVTRNLSVSVTWLEEMSRYMQVWFVSVGVALAVRIANLPSTEFLQTLVKEKGKRIIQITIQVIMLLFSVAMMVFGAPLMMHLVKTGQKTPNMKIPIVLAYLGIYFGFFLFIVFISANIFKILRSESSKATPQEV